MAVKPTCIVERIRIKIDAPLLTSLPLDRQFADYLFDPETCWQWVGAYSVKKKFGRNNGAPRPVIQLAGRGSPVVHVARVVLLLRDGVSLLDPPEGLQAAHSCDNAGCVNPFHLEWRTGLANMGEQRERVQRTVEELRAALGSLT